MKATMVIPSYWGRAGTAGIQETDAVYDHPTPLDGEGTLRRALESLRVLKNREFQLVVIAAATAEDIQAKVEEKVSRIIGAGPWPVPVHLFSHSHLKEIHHMLDQAGAGRFSTLLQLRGYSNIRNLCLFLPHLLDSEVAVLIDDDEVFEDARFMEKACEFVGKTVEGTFVGAVAGYYLQPDGDWHVRREKRDWMSHWDKIDRMNEAFDQIIGTEPRLKETPFVFGGNMVVHREIFKRIPFDPMITRGEDIDFLINMRMYGHTFFLDNTLAIQHLPPPKSHPIWKQIREDVQRFLVERAKIRDQEPMEGMIQVSADQLDPYPGAFLKSDLEEKIEKACTILAREYRAEGKEADAAEALKNIALAAAVQADEMENGFQRLIRVQRLWEELMEFVGSREVKEALAATFAGGA